MHHEAHREHEGALNLRLYTWLIVNHRYTLANMDILILMHHEEHRGHEGALNLRLYTY